MRLLAKSDSARRRTERLRKSEEKKRQPERRIKELIGEVDRRLRMKKAGGLRTRRLSIL
jgi:hypothetical protein